MTWNNAKINQQRAVRRMSMDESLVLENFNTGGARMGGRWVDAASVTSSITASVQIADGEIKELLPEGVRNRKAIEVWSLSELRPVQREDGKKSSRVHWEGRSFEVYILEDWWEQGRYWFALCSQVDQ